MNALHAFTLLLLHTFCLTSAEDPDPLEIQYKSKTITSTSGSSVKLVCQVYYDPGQCGQIHALWFHLDPDFELTDPGKYYTVVNETVTENKWRHRQVLTEILDLDSEDKGRYQCQAVAAVGFNKTRPFMGHFITVIVKG